MQTSVKPIIAVVGLSMKPHRASYQVAQYMQRHGYTIVPVNPKHVGDIVLGERCYSDLQDAATALARHGKRIAIVNCFRNPADIPPIADDAIAIQANCLWMQLGIVQEAAAEKARAAGLGVVMDRCIKIDHANGALDRRLESARE